MSSTNTMSRNFCSYSIMLKYFLFSTTSLTFSAMSNLTNFFVCKLTRRKKKKKFYRWWSDKLNDNFFLRYQQLLRNLAFSIGFNFCSLKVTQKKIKKTFPLACHFTWDEVSKRRLVERVKKRIVIGVTSFLRLWLMLSFFPSFTHSKYWILP